MLIHTWFEGILRELSDVRGLSRLLGVVAGIETSFDRLTGVLCVSKQHFGTRHVEHGIRHIGYDKTFRNDVMRRQLQAYHSHSQDPAS